MSDAHRQWQEIKANYLKAIEKSLAEIDHPQRNEILANVSEHLDDKYAELPSAQQSWEGYQQIITEMGPPREYAELLAEDTPSKAKSTSRINSFLAFLFVIVLIIVSGYLIFNAKNTPVPPTSSTIPSVHFEPDTRVLGAWVTIDFVKTPENFDPAAKSWQGELFLKELVFENHGIVWGTYQNGGPYKHAWTNGKVNPGHQRPALYHLKTIDGKSYLFFEWISGDVTERGREPAYYVLKKED